MLRLLAGSARRLAPAVLRSSQSAEIAPIRRTVLASQGVQSLVAPFGTINRHYAAQPHASESFLTGTSSTVIEQLYESYQKDPASVDATWREFFKKVDSGAEPGDAVSIMTPPMLETVRPKGGAPADVNSVKQAVYDTVRLMTLLRMYRVRGHLNAKLDPLGLQQQPKLADLDPATYGFSAADLQRQIIAPPPLGKNVSELDKYTSTSAAQALEQIRKVYCESVGVEYYHIHDAEQRDWLQAQIESPQQPLSRQDKLFVYEHLAHAEIFETFLAKKFGIAKRFGAEGGEAMLPLVETIVNSASDHGIESVGIGMPHRGRLNVLANTMRKPYRAILQGFQHVDEPVAKNHAAADVQGSGDVKYHLGTTVDRELANGKKIHVTLSPNPSHLEAVNPVVEGRTRAKQFYSDDTTRDRAMSVLMHGDAAFAGQGVVAETLAFSDLHFFTTGGTIHIIINNQIGFTTDPISGRSTPYPSDIAKGAGAPIFHVNGDDPEAVVRVGRLAVAWRQRFHKSIVVDMVCYRRHGHNETDEPSFTQPRMYKKIGQHATTKTLYREKLLADGVVTKEELDAIDKPFVELLENEFKEAKSYKHDPMDWIPKPWKDLRSEPGGARPTGVPEAELVMIGKHLSTVPQGFTPHPKLTKAVIEPRRNMIESKKGIDWGMGEALAYGSLVVDGMHVRLSGQDVERGTFSHRHAVWHDVEKVAPASKYVALDSITKDQGRFIVGNSSLSEFGVLGFEYGTSLESPWHLPIWEAQFGDFANGAQVIFDQFVSSGEAKWYVQSGLVCLLPHGYDGQGPEHSSCRTERFLQMCSEDSDLITSHWDEEVQLRNTNWQVANPSTPANFFHIIRRQVKRNFRKPLIVSSPKRILRMPLSDLSEFLPGTAFQSVLPEKYPHELVSADHIRKVVFVTGQLYYDLVKARKEKEVKDVAIVRIEQLAPFPFAAVRREAAKYPNAEYAWAQEEPKNMGGWDYVRPRFENALNSSSPPTYVGRVSAASPATGHPDQHQRELRALLEHAMAKSAKKVF